MARKKKTGAAPRYDAFEHPEARSPMRPDVGTQASFKKKKPPVTYRYDSSLAPALDWDGQNPAREQGERILAELTEQLGQIHEALKDPGLDATLRERLTASAAKMYRADRTTQGDVPPLPELGRQGRATLFRRADTSSVCSRETLDKGNSRDTQRAQTRHSQPRDFIRPLRRPPPFDC
jgi:hypothetical protein